MKILVTADLHGSERGVKNIENFLEKNYDVVILDGDITQFGPPARARDIITKIKKENIRILSLPGNCDPRDVLPILKEENVNLHSKSVEIGGIPFVGLGGSNTTPFGTPFELSEKEIMKNLKSLVQKIDKNWVLITHAPPHNTKADLTSDKNHAGSKSVRRIIEGEKPLLNVCAHIHEARGINKIGETKIVNPGAISEGYAAEVNLDKEIEVNLLEV